jgi:hypothetical protein
VLLSPGWWRERADRLFSAALAGVAALLLTTPHWLMFLEALTQSFTAYDKPYVQFAGRREAIAFFLGPLTPGPVQPGFHLLGLVLTIAAVAAPRQILERPRAVVCGIGAAALMAVAFGAVPASMIITIPLLSNIGHIHDAFLAAALPPLLILTAFGADTLLNATRRRSAIVAVVVWVVSWWLYANVRQLARDDSLDWLLFVVLIPVAIVLPGCFYAARTGPRRLLAGVATIIASSALVLPGSLHADTRIPVLDNLLLQPRLRAELDKNSPAVDAIHLASTEPSRTVGLGWTLFAGSQAFYELEGIGGADPLELGTYRELVDAAGILRSMVWITMVPAPDVQRLGPLLDLLNVSFFIVPRDSVVSGLVDVPVASADRVKVERRTTAWPRAFFVDSVRTYVDAADLLRQVAAHGQPLAAVQSSDRQAIDATREIMAAPGKVIPARGYKLTANTTSLVVRASGPGVAVLSETFLPRDFRATLNGHQVPYFRVNHAFKAVAIPSAGDWEVKFEYRPHRWDLSLVAAGLGIVLLAGLSVSARKPRQVVETTVSEKPAARASS